MRTTTTTTTTTTHPPKVFRAAVWSGALAFTARAVGWPALGKAAFGQRHPSRPGLAISRERESARARVHT